MSGDIHPTHPIAREEHTMEHATPNDEIVPNRDVVDLPLVVDRYLDAHDRHDLEPTLATFASNACVVDEGHAHRGIDEIRDWLDRVATEFTYTRTLTGVAQESDDVWVVSNRIEGDFPGNVVDLGYRFTLVDDHIAELVIAP